MVTGRAQPGLASRARHPIGSTHLGMTPPVHVAHQRAIRIQGFQVSLSDSLVTLSRYHPAGDGPAPNERGPGCCEPQMSSHVPTSAPIRRIHPPASRWGHRRSSWPPGRPALPGWSAGSAPRRLRRRSTIGAPSSRGPAGSAPTAWRSASRSPMSSHRYAPGMSARAGLPPGSVRPCCPPTRAGRNARARSTCTTCARCTGPSPRTWGILARASAGGRIAPRGPAGRRVR